MYAIEINKKDQAIKEIMEYYSSESSLISIEGYELIKLFEHFEGCDISETDVLPRQTTWPKLNYYILPLTNESVPNIFNEIQSKELLHFEEGIIHIQISQNNKRVFYGCDNLHPQCTVVTGEINQEFLDKLLNEGVLSDYEELKKCT